MKSGPTAAWCVFLIEASEGDGPTIRHQEQLACPAAEVGCVTFTTRSPHS